MSEGQGRGALPALGQRSEAHLLRGLLGLVQIGLIGQPETILERGSRPPSQLTQTADIEQFARRAVRLRWIELDVAAVADDSAHQPGQLADRQVLAGADIDRARASE